MVHDWKECGVSCEDCACRPHLKEVLGCGTPPTRDDVDVPVFLWSEKNGETLSPAKLASRGEMPYQGFGYGDVRYDWEWCPIWFSRFSEAKIGGETPYVFISRAHRYREKGSLGQLIPGEWTSSLVELLDFYDLLESERLKLKNASSSH